MSASPTKCFPDTMCVVFVVYVYERCLSSETGMNNLYTGSLTQHNCFSILMM